jgi:hypothetical protein
MSEPVTPPIWTFWYPQTDCTTEPTSTPERPASRTRACNSARNPASSSSCWSIAAASAVNRDGLSGAPSRRSSAAVPALSARSRNRERTRSSRPSNPPATAATTRSPAVSKALAIKPATTPPSVNDTGSITAATSCAPQPTNYSATSGPPRIYGHVSRDLGAAARHTRVVTSHGRQDLVPVPRCARSPGHRIARSAPHRSPRRLGVRPDAGASSHRHELLQCALAGTHRGSRRWLTYRWTQPHHDTELCRRAGYGAALPALHPRRSVVRHQPSRPFLSEGD